MNMTLATILLLLLVSVGILGFNRYKVKAGYLWVLALGGSILASGMFLLSRPVEPLVLLILPWNTAMGGADGLALLVDEVSWPFSVAVLALSISVLLTDIARVPDIDPQSWATGLMITAVGLVGVLSANPLTLLMTWVAINLVEVVILLSRVTDSSQREKAVIAFSARVLGLIMVVSAILRADALGEALSWDRIPGEVSGYLVLAAGVWLGIFPPHQPFLREPPVNRGLGTLIRLVPVAIALVLLRRVALVGVPGEWEITLLVLAGLAALTGSLTWMWAEDELKGRPAWILGMAALAAVAAVEGQPLAAQVWGLALLCLGGMLFLFSTRNRRVLLFPAIGVLSLSALPFTPVWSGLSLYTGRYGGLMVLLVVSQTLLLLGFARHGFRQEEVEEDVERWVWITYPLGLAVLPLALVGLVIQSGGYRTQPEAVLAFQWWGGAFILGLAVLMVYLLQFRFQVSFRSMASFSRVFSLHWLYQMIWWLYRWLSRAIAAFSALLEGEGGVLWGILIFILLFSLAVQVPNGGW